MTNMTKFLIATGVTAVGIGITVYYGKKMADKEKEVVITEIDEDGNATIEEVKNESIIKKIKKAALKKTIKILAWVTLHQQQVEAVVTILSLGGAVFSVVNAVRDFRTSSNMREDIDSMLDHNSEFRDIWNKYVEIEHNRHDEIMTKLNDIHLDMSLLHEVHESLVEPPKKVSKIKSAS